MKFKNRFLSLILSCAVAFTSVNGTAFAEQIEEPAVVEQQEEAPEEEAAQIPSEEEAAEEEAPEEEAAQSPSEEEVVEKEAPEEENIQPAEDTPNESELLEEAEEEDKDEEDEDEQITSYKELDVITTHYKLALDSLREQFPNFVTAYTNKENEIQIRIYEWTAIDDYDENLGDYKFAPVIDTDMEVAEDVEEPVQKVHVEDESQGPTGYIQAERDYEVPFVEDDSEPSSGTKGLLRASAPAATDTSYNAYEVGNLLPEMRDQDNEGACWAFAAMGAIEADLIKKGQADTKIDLSELQLAYFTSHDSTDPKNCHDADVLEFVGAGSYLSNGGNDDIATMALFNKVGAVEEKYVPYSKGSSYVVPEVYALGKDYAQVQNVYEININDRNTIKQAILDHGAVSAAINSNSQYSAVYNSMCDAKTSTNHAILLVGWDDSFPRDNFIGSNTPSGDGAWLVRNSWGLDDYGAHGYFWISYNDGALQSSGSVMAYEARNQDMYDNVYSYATGSATQLVSYTNSEGKAKSLIVKYNVSAGETIKAVSVQTINTNSRLDVTVKAGSEIGTGSCNTVTAGTYTIELDNQIEINTNTEVTVTIKITPPSNQRVTALAEASGERRIGDVRHVIKDDSGFEFNGKHYDYDAKVRLYTDNGTSGSSTPSPEEGKLEVSNPSIYDHAGTTHQIAFTADSLQGVNAPDVTWSVINEDVATVNEAGVITVGCKKGTTVVQGTYTDGVKTYEVSINVTVQPYNINYQFNEGESYRRLFRTYYPGDADNCYLQNATEMVEDFSKTGYKVVAFEKPDGTVVTKSDLVNMTGDITLIPKWTKYAITLRFYVPKADLKGFETTKTYISNVQITDAPYKIPTAIAESVTKPEGYVFHYWSTDEVGEKRLSKITRDSFVAEKGKYTGKYSIKSEYIIYPHYRDTNAYVVTFDPQSGELDDSERISSLYYGDNYGRLPTPTRAGYIFVGWYTDNEDFSTEISSSDYFYLHENQTLYARWWKQEQVAKPVFDVADTYSEEQKNNINNVGVGSKVSLSTSTNGALIYYTTDSAVAAAGYKENAGWNKYTDAITLDVAGGTTITYYAVAVKSGYADSEVASARYTVEDMDAGATKGIHIEGVNSSYPYTGAAVKLVPDNSGTDEFGFQVYNNATVLEYKKDYTYSLKNNTKAGTATLTVTGKGNFAGVYAKNFEIAKVDLNSADISAEDVAVLYNKNGQKPSVKVTWRANGKNITLKNGTDYTYKWETAPNSNTYDTKKVSAVGTYNLRITAKDNGNFGGTRDIKFIILKEGIKLMSKANVKLAYTSVECDGTAKEPAVEWVKMGSTELGNLEYKVSYQNNTDVGTASVIIKSTDDSVYYGSKLVDFTIKGIAFNKTQIDPLEDVEYDGNAHYQTPKVTYDGKVLTKGTDYDIAYTNCTDVGKQTLTFKGKGRYNGTVKKTFVITAYDIQADSRLSTESARKIKISWPADVPIPSGETMPTFEYGKGGTKPAVKVTFNGNVLVEGTDYTLKYTNNNGLNDGSVATKVPTVIITGKKNFAKTSDTKLTFKISQKDMSVKGAVTVNAADKVYSKKANIYKSAPEVYDGATGKKLAAGTDYERLKNSDYTYAENVTIMRKSGSAYYEEKTDAGTVVGAEDIIPLGTVIKVTITGKNCYKGTNYATYRFVGANISGYTVKVADNSSLKSGIDYTGKQNYISKSDLVVKKGKEVLSNDDYDIVEYSKNTNKGSATVTLRGKGNYGGTKKYTFKINAKTMGYKLSYSLGGGKNNPDNPTTYTVLNGAEGIKNPLPRDGYTFEGWYYNSSYTKKLTYSGSGDSRVWTFDPNPDKYNSTKYGNRTIYARWTKIK